MYFNQYKNEYFDVENLALRYYSLHEKLNGMHCENAVGKYLYGLLFWDIVFESKLNNQNNLALLDSSLKKMVLKQK